MRPLIRLISVFAFAATSVAGQEVCPCVPVTHEWIVTACDTWNCAASAVIAANGDRYVMPLPTNSADYTWVVMRRIVSGSGIASPNAPFKIDGFDGLAEATARYYSIDSRLQPMLVTAPDGKVLVVARAEAEPPRRRTVPH